MSRRAQLTALALLGGAAMAVVLVAGSATSREPIAQPVAFNHKAHVETGMTCADCHMYFATQTFSGLPTIEDCLGCHEEAITESPEEEKIRQAAARGESLVWNRLYTVPNHVYSSHRRHVVAEGLDCATCHGPIAEATRPPPHPLNVLSMDFCLDCHEQTGASLDCIACHK